MNKKLNLQEIKNIELQMLLAFHNFCRDNSLQYSLCGGSLLGAIRHKGFIPWDDDIDIFMPRPDYERLRQIAGSKCIQDNCYVLDWRTSKQLKDKPFMFYPFLKLIDLSTEVNTKDFPIDKYYSGIWIDIFPIEGLPNSEVQIKKLYNKSWFWRQIFSLHYCDKIIAKGTFQKIIKLPLLPFAKVLRGKYLCKKLDLLSQKYNFNDASIIGSVINAYGPQEELLKTDIEPMEIEFEGYKFWGIKGYDVYLSNLYHDYMQLPPKEKRIIHGFDAWKIE